MRNPHELFERCDSGDCHRYLPGKNASHRFFQTGTIVAAIEGLMYYIPYAVLGSMTFPAILESTRSTFSAGTGFLVAILLTYFNRGLLQTALGAAAAVFIVEYLTL